MNECTMVFKRSLFGGYEREGVLVYIQDMMGQQEQLQAELDKVKSLHQTMADQNQQLYSQLASQNKNMDRLITQLAVQKGELDSFRARQAQLEEQEAKAQTILEEAEYQAKDMVERARQEQERLTTEALRMRKKAISDTEQRLKELRELAEGLWGMLGGAQNADRESG